MVVCGVEYYGNCYQIATSASPIFLPTVTTIGMDVIGQTTASIDYSVTSDGGSPVTAHGVAYSVSPTPTIAGSHTNDGTGTGTFTSSLIGLIADTTYYVRAYATNSLGTSYGSQINFTTVSPKSINLYQTYYNLGDGTICSCREFCIQSTPGMSIGDCYCLCLRVPLGLPSILIGTGSYASVCVTCNNVCKFCGCLTIGACNNGSVSFPVGSTDCVHITNEAYVCALGCGGSANSCTCITGTAAISGSFQVGSMCCMSCTHTG